MKLVTARPGKTALRSQPYCSPAIKVSAPRIWQDQKTRRVGCFRGWIPLLLFILWGRRSQASENWLETSLFPAGWCPAGIWGPPGRVGGGIAPRKERVSSFPPAPGPGAQPDQQHCNTRLARNHWWNCTSAPHLLPHDVNPRAPILQHPSTSPSSSRLCGKHSLVNSLLHYGPFPPQWQLIKKNTRMISFKNSSALRACGCNYCLYGQVYYFSFLPSPLCYRKHASFQASCFMTIGRKFPKSRV